jgi:hypothetical protein
MKINEQQAKIGLYILAGFLTYKFVFSILQKTGLVEDESDKGADKFKASEFLTPAPFIEWMKTNKDKNGNYLINYIDNPSVKMVFSGTVNDLFESKGFWNDDEENVYKIFRLQPSKIHISALSYYFLKAKGRSLPDYIAGFMNNNELNNLNKIVNSKPSTFNLQIN